VRELLAVVVVVAGVGAIVWGAEAFAEHLGAAATTLRVSPFALALLLAGAEPEELVTGVTASLRHVPAVALGDVAGANIAICLVALGVGALVAPLPLGPRVRRYGLLGLPLGLLAAALAWDGRVGRIEGLVLVAAYVCYVAAIWRLEGAPPALGETAALAEAETRLAAEPVTRRRVGRDVAIVLAAVVAMAAGATALVEAVRHLAHVESSQARLSLTLVGFATAFELVVLAWSASRRGASETVVAAVVGSFAYNATMTLGGAALARPLRLAAVVQFRGPLLLMDAAMVLVLGLAFNGRLDRRDGVVLLGGYFLFLLVVLV